MELTRQLEGSILPSTHATGEVLYIAHSYCDAARTDAEVGKREDNKGNTPGSERINLPVVICGDINNK